MPESGVSVLREISEGDSENCLVHPDRKPMAYSVMCRGCYDRERRLGQAFMDLYESAGRWLSETGGMHVNTAKGRHDTARAIERLQKLLDEDH